MSGMQAPRTTITQAIQRVPLTIWTSALIAVAAWWSLGISLGQSTEANFSIPHHSVNLTIWPGNQSLTCSDSFTVQSNSPNLDQIDLLLSDMEEVVFKSSGQALEWQRENLGSNISRIKLKLPQALPENHTTTVVFSAKKDRYQFPMSFQGYFFGSYGQVGEESTFSSHIRYYPTDTRNDATGEMQITVPRGYVAVSVGVLLSIRQEEETVTYTWATNISTPRILPFGFAVARYRQVETQSGKGTPVQLYYREGEEQRANDTLKVARDAVDFCEELFGKCPFEKVAIAHIYPERNAEAPWAVSLPTLILISDWFFDKPLSYNFDDDPVEKSMDGALVIVDEISHQWNGYGIGFPNELAEGFAQYTDTLFAERHSKNGERTLQRHMQYYEEIYKQMIGLFPDAPISSPQVYNTSAYLGIAFCKGAMVLNMLRYVTTDQVFFSALEDLFTTRRGIRNSYPDLQAVMEKHFGSSLGWFFEEWYNQTGYPAYQVTMRVLDEEGPPYGVEVCIAQLQEGYVYTMPLDVTIFCQGGSEAFPRIMVDSANFTIPLRLGSKPFSARIDLDENLLKDARYPAGEITILGALLFLALTTIIRMPSHTSLS